jgi:putative transposase
MPDHLHLLLQATAANSELLPFVRAFKHKTSHRFRARTGKTLWQTSFYDHILRRAESPTDVTYYILSNPVRAGLVRNPWDYPYSGLFGGEWPGTDPPLTCWYPPSKSRPLL